MSIGNGVTRIGDDAFLDCGSLTIYSPAGSYAETFARQNGIPFSAIGLN